jgi:hypothetical protein
MDSHNDPRGHSHAMRPHIPDQYVSLDGLSLIWIDTILLVPVIFGVMFLPTPVRLAVLAAVIVIGAAFGILYSRFRAQRRVPR